MQLKLIYILTTVAAVLVMIGKGCGVRKLSAAFAALSVCLLCGCSRNAADDDDTLERVDYQTN